MSPKPARDRETRPLCSRCGRNKGSCSVHNLALTAEEKSMVKVAWGNNNKDGRCFFWKKGVKRGTHYEGS